jgi:hypothetical protein
MIGNFLGSVGRFLCKKNRMPLFLGCLAIGPIGASIFLYLEKQEMAALEETSAHAIIRSKSAFDRKARKEAFFAKHRNSDPYFLDKEIESLSFLNHEKQQLIGWLNHPAISNKEKLTRRMNYLQQGENRCTFAEEEIQVSKTCKETKEKQRYPVEVDMDDINKLLTLIEESPILENGDLGMKGRPQLLIYSFSMIKKNAPLQNEVFEITMDLLKREFKPK